MTNRMKPPFFLYLQKYELEIQQLEKERGFDVTFVKPEVRFPHKTAKLINQTKYPKSSYEEKFYSYLQFCMIPHFFYFQKCLNSGLQSCHFDAKFLCDICNPK